MYDFYYLITILNKSVFLIGISPYSIKKSQCVIEILPNKKGNYFSIFVRVLLSIMSIISLYYLNYEFKSLNEIIMNAAKFTLRFSGGILPVFAYIFRKRYIKAISTLTVLDKNICKQCKVFKKSLSYRTLILIFYICILFSFLFMAISIIVDVSLAQYFEELLLLEYLSYYVYYFFMCIIMINFIVYVYYIKLCFKCINESIIEVVFGKNLSMDSIISLNKLHDETMDVFHLILNCYGEQVIFFLTIEYTFMILNTYGLIEFGWNSTLLLIEVIMYLGICIIPIFVIIYVCDSAITEAQRVLQLAKKFPFHKNVIILKHIFAGINVIYSLLDN